MHLLWQQRCFGTGLEESVVQDPCPSRERRQHLRTSRPFLGDDQMCATHVPAIRGPGHHQQPFSAFCAKLRSTGQSSSSQEIDARSFGHLQELPCTRSGQLCTCMNVVTLSISNSMLPVRAMPRLSAKDSPSLRKEGRFHDADWRTYRWLRRSAARPTLSRFSVTSASSRSWLCMPLTVNTGRRSIGHRPGVSLPAWKKR